MLKRWIFHADFPLWCVTIFLVFFLHACMHASHASFLVKETEEKPLDYIDKTGSIFGWIGFASGAVVVVEVYGNCEKRRWEE